LYDARFSEVTMNNDALEGINQSVQNVEQAVQGPPTVG
jgi:hypothetical protein